MNNDLRIATEKITKLPTLPSTAQEILAILDCDETLPKDIEEIILKDPAISAKILSFSSSAFLSGGSRPKNLQEAILRIGFSNVKYIALGISLMSVFGDKSHGIIDYERIFKHSFAVASVSNLLAKELKYHKNSNLFLYGLLHDIGYLVLNRFFGDIYQQVLKVNRQGTLLIDAERVVCGFTHSDVGEWLGKKWKLPEEVNNCIAHHHTPDKTEKHRNEVALIHLADYIVSRDIISVAQGETVFFVDDDILKQFHLSKKQFDTLVKRICAQANS